MTTLRLAAIFLLLPCAAYANPKTFETVQALRDGVRAGTVQVGELVTVSQVRVTHAPHLFDEEVEFCVNDLDPDGPDVEVRFPRWFHPRYEEQRGRIRIPDPQLGLGDFVDVTARLEVDAAGRLNLQRTYGVDADDDALTLDVHRRPNGVVCVRHRISVYTLRGPLVRLALPRAVRAGSLLSVRTGSRGKRAAVFVDGEPARVVFRFRHGLVLRMPGTARPGTHTINLVDERGVGPTYRFEVRGGEAPKRPSLTDGLIFRPVR